MNTKIEDVLKFYKFWDNFQSWRDFSHFNEYDIREASDRYERRYMEKENKKIKDKHLKKERLRLINLAEYAYQADPRIKKLKLEEELEKKRKKEEIKQKKDQERKIIEDRIKEEERKKREIIEQKEREEK